MSARDDLVEVVGEQLEHPPVKACPACADAGRVADAILAAGYRKLRTITTVEELASAPGGIVVREPLGLIWEKQGNGEGGTFWVETGDEQEYKDADISLPATVLWEPQP